MSQGERSELSLTQRPEICSRWKAGQSLHEIGSDFGKPRSSIRYLLLARGGIPPATRRRCVRWSGQVRGQNIAQRFAFINQLSGRWGLRNTCFEIFPVPRYIRAMRHSCRHRRSCREGGDPV